MNTSEVSAGTIATVKVGRNEVEVEVIEVLENKWKVKSVSTGREFTTGKLVSIVKEPDNPAPATESGTAPKKKTSLIDAAFEVLAKSEERRNPPGSAEPQLRL